MSNPVYNPFISILDRATPDLAYLHALLAQGVDPNVPWEHDETALMVAAGLGHEQAVDLLLEAGADPSLQDAWGRTASIWAAEVHNVELAKRLWKTQSKKSSSELISHDLSATRLDAIETPLTDPQVYMVLYSMRYHLSGQGRFVGLGADAGREAALQRISKDNNRAVQTGPYLLCRRVRLPDETITRPTNPLATSLKSYRLNASQLLVLAHLPTTTTDPGRLISRQHNPWFRGWATITAVFTQETIQEAGKAALAEPGRVSLVQLSDVCTCYEGWVECHEALVKTADALRTYGNTRIVWPV